MSFLPENYERPQTGGQYMKLADGENRIRILSDAIVGYEYWLMDGDKRKPIRVRTAEEVPAEEKVKVGKDKVKFFWAMLVWNYKDLKGQILEVTQGTVQGPIESYIEDKDWGDPKNYDLKINKSGEGIETEYSVIAVPPTKFLVEGKDIPTVNLSALYDGTDPFIKSDAMEGNVEALGDDIDKVLEDIDKPKGKKENLVEDLITVFDELGKSSDDMMKFVQKNFEVDSPNDMTDIQLENLIKALKIRAKRGAVKKEPKTIQEEVSELDLGGTL